MFDTIIIIILGILAVGEICALSWALWYTYKLKLELGHFPGVRVRQGEDNPMPMTEQQHIEESPTENRDHSRG